MKKRKTKKRKKILITICIAVLLLCLYSNSNSITFPHLTTNIMNTNSNMFSTVDVIPVSGNLHSAHMILLDLDAHKIICQKASNEKTYPASLTKIMTAIVAIENISDLQQNIILPKSLFDDLYKENASMAGFLPNEEVKAIDLLYGTILPSGAEAAGGLANYVSGSETDFVKLMNEKSKKLGMKNTNFINVSGLHDPNHYTTVKDLAILLEYALKNKTFSKIFTSKMHSTSPSNIHPDGITFHSTMFQKIKGSEFKEDIIIGGKTGYTSEAGLCLASLAKKDGKQYILVTTGAEGSYATKQYNIDDAFSIYSKYLKSK